MLGSSKMHRYPPCRRPRPACIAGLSAFLVTLLFQFHCLAGETLIIDSDKQFAFAETLFTQGEFRQAIDEYRRFVYFFPNDPRTDTARFNVGRSYMELNEFEQAVMAFRALLNRAPKGALFLDSYRRISECQVKLRQYDAAVRTLENLIKQTDDRDIRDEANYRIGWIYIETGSFHAARDYLNRIRPQNRTLYNIDHLFAELAKEPLLEKKSPLLAGTLSIVPGLGYLYCDRLGDALISFIVNSAMIYATYAAIDNDNPALGGILAFVELGFYSANIYGSTTSAHKFNRRKEQDFIETLKRNTRLHLSSTRGTRGMLFTLQYRF